MHLLLLLIGLCGAAVMQTAVAAPPLPGMVLCQTPMCCNRCSQRGCRANSAQRSEISRGCSTQLAKFPALMMRRSLPTLAAAAAGATG